jgi:hypothetical protein
MLVSSPYGVIRCAMANSMIVRVEGWYRARSMIAMNSGERVRP